MKKNPPPAADFSLEMAYTIRWLRKHCGAKQVAWANLLGMGRSNYSRIESGKRPLTFKQLEVIAAQADMRPEEIVVLSRMLARAGHQFGCFGISLKIWLTLMGKNHNIKFTDEEVSKIIMTVEDIYFRKPYLP